MPTRRKELNSASRKKATARVSPGAWRRGWRRWRRPIPRARRRARGAPRGAARGRRGAERGCSETSAGGHPLTELGQHLDVAAAVVVIDRRRSPFDTQAGELAPTAPAGRRESRHRRSPGPKSGTARRPRNAPGSGSDHRRSGTGRSPGPRVRPRSTAATSERARPWRPAAASSISKTTVGTPSPRSWRTSRVPGIARNSPRTASATSSRSSIVRPHDPDLDRRFDRRPLLESLGHHLDLRQLALGKISDPGDHHLDRLTVLSVSTTNCARCGLLGRLSRL